MKRYWLRDNGKMLFAAVACMAVFATAGCAKVQYGAATIDSNPPGAEIVNLKDNTNLGKTPATVVWRGDSMEQVTVQFRKKGYNSAISSFWINKRHPSSEEAKINAIGVYGELEKE